jgi:peptide/nickel transport system permease protein
LPKYIGKRLLLLVPTLLGVIFLVFLIMALIPGDPGRIQLGIDASQEAVDLFNKQFGLDRPFFIRFFDYIAKIFTQFDFGASYRSHEAVLDSIIGRVPPTVIIAVFSVITSLLIGIPLGVLSAIRRSTLVDTGVTVLALFLAAIPSFWFGLMLLQLFSITLGLLPSHGAETWRGYILPVLALSVPGSSGFIRLTRVTMLDVVHQEYIKTARAKGAPEYSVIWKHAFRNAALPLINGAGLMFGALLGGTVIIESVFSLPGIGNLIVTAIQQRDLPLVMGCTIFLSAMFMLIILGIDIIYALFDPRVGKRMTEQAKAGR